MVWWGLVSSSCEHLDETSSASQSLRRFYFLNFLKYLKNVKNAKYAKNSRNVWNVVMFASSKYGFLGNSRIT